MKKVLFMLLAVMLLTTLSVFAVEAESEFMYCPRCDQDVAVEDWQEWNFEGGDVTGGHYRLTDDWFAQKETIRIPSGNVVCLDLNGHVYSAGQIRMFNVHGTFTVMDSKGGGTILSAGENAKYGGFALVQSSATFNLYSGTIRFAAVPGVTPYTGGLFYIEGGRVDIHGGTVAGGTVAATSSLISQGGNFAVHNGGRLYIRGGTVTGGIAYKSSSKTAQGGNIFASSNSQVFIYGGTVEDGYCDAGGGNIFVAEASLEMSGGTLRNGHALVSGGNIMANATNANAVTISGGAVTGGVAGGTYGSYSNSTFTRGSKGGGNIYERSPQGSLTISGGTIDGDIVLDYAKTVTLSGAPQIGLGKAGGMLFTDLGTFKANASGLTEGAQIYVQASRVFTENFTSADEAQTALGYFKGAVRTEISVSGNALKGTQGTQGYCPHCGEQVTWTAFNNDTTAGGHTYLSGSAILTGNLSVSNSRVLDLNGYTLHIENRRFIFNYDTQDLSLAILDSWGGGKAQGTGTGNAYSGFLYVHSNSTFELLSGTLCLVSPVKDTTPTENIVKTGGVLYAADKTTVNISGGVITGGAVTAAEGCGGNICMDGVEGKLTVSGGIIKNGTATALPGGNIYAKIPVQITGGVIMNGSAKNGGNLYTTGTCEITGGIVIKGSASVYGGNLYPYGGADISGGLIVSGTAATGAGNIGVYGSEVDISGNAAVMGGKSESRGGNIAVGSSGVVHISGGLVASGDATTRGGNLDTATTNSKCNMDGGKIVGGTAHIGGNLFINNGKLNMIGGAVLGGVADQGGNIYLSNYITATIKDDGKAETPLPCISHGKATGGNGGNVYFMAAEAANQYYLHLGNCVIRAGQASGNGQNIYVSEKGMFYILEEFAGSTTAYFHESRNPVKGGVLTEALAGAEGDYTGQLRLENIGTNPLVCAQEGKLRVTAAGVVLQDGTSQWFGTNEEAVASYTEQADYLIPDAGALVLRGGSYTVDLAGQNLTVTGTGTLTCFDSANDTYETYGIATIDGPVLANPLKTVAKGKTYITLAEENGYSFHRLNMYVSSVSVRPSSAGVYYSCLWDCDETLASGLQSFGVAVSIKDQPGADFATDADTLYTRFEPTALTPGKSQNSVLVNKILKSGNPENDSRGRKAVYAAPYIVLENGQSILATNEVAYSLHSVMTMMDERIGSDPTNYRKFTNPLRAFHNTWKEDGMQTWTLTKIPEPAEDDVIDVLMIGSSFCYYYVEELYGLAEAAGVKMRVCNLYYSGCKFTWHYNWWKSGNGPYEFYQVVDGTGRKKTSGVTLEYALAQGDWDVISIQESTSTICSAGAQKHLEDTREMREELIGYLKEQFPKAKHYWQSPWTHQAGYVYGGTPVDFDWQQNRMMIIRDFALGVCEENGLGRVNTGEAWQIFRQKYVLPGTFQDTLCARLGVSTFNGQSNSGDGYHDGDIGGGQYLNACVWFETLMNDLYPEGNYTCVGNTYDPTYGGSYKLSAELRQAFQECAHQAYLERDWETPSTEKSE